MPLGSNSTSQLRDAWPCWTAETVSCGPMLVLFHRLRWGLRPHAPRLLPGGAPWPSPGAPTRHAPRTQQTLSHEVSRPEIPQLTLPQRCPPSRHAMNDADDPSCRALPRLASFAAPRHSVVCSTSVPSTTPGPAPAIEPPLIVFPGGGTAILPVLPSMPTTCAIWRLALLPSCSHAPKNMTPPFPPAHTAGIYFWWQAGAVKALEERAGISDSKTRLAGSLAFSHSPWAHQTCEPRLFSAPRLTRFNHEIRQVSHVLATKQSNDDRWVPASSTFGIVSLCSIRETTEFGGSSAYSITYSRSDSFQAEDFRWSPTAFRRQYRRLKHPGWVVSL